MTRAEHLEKAEALLASAVTYGAVSVVRTNLLLEAQVHLALAAHAAAEPARLVFPAPVSDLRADDPTLPIDVTEIRSAASGAVLKTKPVTRRAAPKAKAG